MHQGFWNNLKKPIIGLSPMDGITDEPFRFITTKYGKPDVTMTEFTSVEGICHGAVKTLRAFLYDESERPIVAQLFGVDVPSFYKSTFVVAELGFDGIDINMGCPANSVAARGAGASLIRTPKLAKEIIRSVQQAAKDWANGKNIDEVDLPENIVEYIKKYRPQNIKRKLLPVSVKTRIGYNSIIVEEWIKHLLEENPANISIHGRTLKQMYNGNADWEAIARAADIIHQTKTLALGNGDVKNLDDAHEKIKQYRVDGVLIGRAAFGNPWIFKNHTPTLGEKFDVAIEHAKYYEKTIGQKLFIPMRKHLSWYCRGFKNAGEIRKKLMEAKDSSEVAKILTEESRSLSL